MKETKKKKQNQYNDKKHEESLDIGIMQILTDLK